ncbi:MAG: hypothetical protein C0502_03525 [Opitutus sp.]|nr:hypothetical protein [Opitutus sp.]
MSAPRQRLIVCLDGTWNKRDDSTNVCHHFDLSIPENSDGPLASAVRQKLYYDEGVGTGLLDGISGGAFGIGLEENVREAYNWLVEHFNDSGGGAAYAADEIFVFGFSRGAYTARSLVGFIGRCGLLRRGSPISVNELWRAYCELGRRYEERRSAWDRVPQGGLPFRERNALSPDPWKPQETVPDLTPKEKLLAEWSRRVRITYLGIYDTVGAVGVDALAIPGIRSRVALHHNMRPTSLIQRCRHALAIHEHRSSFAHTPLVAYDFKQPGDLTPADWAGRIEQCWFVGAHSNIGGGYDTNTLALQPLRWMLEGAVCAGLRCHPLPASQPAVDELPEPRDSYGEFAAPFAVHLFRMKPHYRPIAPETERRAPADPKDPPGNAFELRSIHEQVHPSVARFHTRKNVAGAPPNLTRYARTRAKVDPQWAEVAELRRPHRWPRPGLFSETWTAWWAAAAAIGFGHLIGFFSGQTLAAEWPWLATFAAFIVMIDWLESRLNHRLAEGEIDTALPGVALLLRLTKREKSTLLEWLNLRLGHSVEPDIRRHRTPAWVAAICDSIYWTRSLGATLATIGLIVIAARCFATGWQHGRTTWQNFPYAETLHWLAYAGAGALALFLVKAMDRRTDGWFASLVCTACAAPVIVAITGLGALTAKLLWIAPDPAPAALPSALQAFGAQYLFLLIALTYLARSFQWVAEPFARVNTGNFFALQFAWNAAKLRALLEDWRLRLTPPGSNEDPAQGPAARRLRGAVAEATWRDSFGFVPVYTLVLGYGLSFAADATQWRWLNPMLWGAPLWFWIIAFTALFDWLEDWFHFGYLATHAQGGTTGSLTVATSFVCSVLKSLLFVVAAVVTVFVAVPVGWLRLWSAHEPVGGAGGLALLAPFIVVALALWLGWLARKN